MTISKMIGFDVSVVYMHLLKVVKTLREWEEDMEKAAYEPWSHIAFFACYYLVT